MDYKTYPVNELLSSLIKCFWSLDAPATETPEKQTIVPDGCMEMIFHYGDRYRQFMDDGSALIQPRCFVFGQISTPLEIEPTGATGMISARFHPDGFAPFNSFPVAEMKNRAVSLYELFGEKGSLLQEEVLNANTNEERVEVIERFLLNELNAPGNIDHLAKLSVDLLLQSKGQVSVDEMAEQLNSSKRQLERRFSSVIGLSPKQLSKIIRLQATLKMMEQKQFTSLTALAYENGYFDQAHFIKDFKEFTGSSPRQFYSGNLKMSALFIGTE